MPVRSGTYASCQEQTCTGAGQFLPVRRSFAAKRGEGSHVLFECNLSAQLWLGACHPTEHCTESAHPEGSIRFRLAAARTPANYASASLFLSTGPSKSDELSRSR